MATWPMLPAQAPATIPPPGVEALGRSGFDQRNPDGADTPYMRTPFRVPEWGSEMPVQVVARVAPPARHPAGPTGTLHPVDPEVGGNEGRHGELVQQSSTPTGSQTPWETNRKTWRAAPEPYDENVYVGWVPTQAVGDP